MLLRVNVRYTYNCVILVVLGPGKPWNTALYCTWELWRFMALNSLLCAHVPLRNCSLNYGGSIALPSWVPVGGPGFFKGRPSMEKFCPSSNTQSLT